jgi:hypothetical protein
MARPVLTTNGQRERATVTNGHQSNFILDHEEFYDDLLENLQDAGGEARRTTKTLGRAVGERFDQKDGLKTAMAHIRACSVWAGITAKRHTVYRGSKK